MFTVDDMLKLLIFNGHRLIAGKGGLERRVQSVDFLEVPDSEQWASPNNFTFTTGYAFRDDPGRLCQIIEAFNKNDSAGLGIKLGRFIDKIPEDALSLADKLNYPLVLLPLGLAYAVVARTVMREIFRTEQSERRLSLENTDLFRLEQDPVELLAALENSGWDRRQNVWCLQWLHAPAAPPRALSLRVSKSSVKSSARLIAAALPGETVSNFIDFIQSDVPQSLEKQIVGLSGPLPLNQFRRSFAEAQKALSVGARLGFSEGLFVYQELELLALLESGAPLQDLRDAAARCLKPLFDEDSKNRSDLVKTLRAWLANGASSAKAAQLLHVHRNTLRYRIEQIEQLIPLARYGSTVYRLALFLIDEKPLS
jgi:DNA-binding PucR family transcriptional regulator